MSNSTAEHNRLEQDPQKQPSWKKWGPYLSERQWGTVREDYSANGDAWNYFSHDQARSRAYRWGEDGLGGICDDQQLLCFALAMWNGRDPILKERLFGLTNSEGNHGEDVKEYYFYLDSTPTHSYMKYLYKYPQRAYPTRTSFSTTKSGLEMIWNTSSSIQESSMTIATSMSYSSTRKLQRTTLRFELQFTIVVQKMHHCACFRHCGIATHGLGYRVGSNRRCLLSASHPAQLSMQRTQNSAIITWFVKEPTDSSSRKTKRTKNGYSGCRMRRRT